MSPFEFAEKNLPLVVFVSTPHWNTSSTLKAYKVSLKGKGIGQVLQAHEHVYKKAGRLRYGDKQILRWKYVTAEGKSDSWRYFNTRKAAVEALLEDLQKATLAASRTRRGQGR